mgnify:CR=1 FL=1
MALKNKQAITFEEEIATKRGEQKSFMTSIFPLQNTHDEVYALGGWSTEITGLKQHCSTDGATPWTRFRRRHQKFPGCWLYQTTVF